MARSSNNPSRVVFSRPKKMLSAAESSSTRFNSWWMMLIPARSASFVVRKRTAVPRSSSVPS